MKILFITYSDISLNVGHTTHVRELVQNLEKLGNSVTLIARVGCIDGIRVTKTYSGGIMEGCGFFTWGIRFLISLLRFLFRISLNTRHSDIVYVRNVKSGFMAIIPKMIFGKKMIFEVNGLSTVEQAMHGQMTWNKILVKILGFMEFVTIKNSDRIISVTGGIKNSITEKYDVAEDKIIVVPNGANTDLFHPMDDQERIEQIKERLKIKREESVIVFVGSLAPWQGVEYLVQASPLILREFPNTRFLIVGDGLMRGKLMESAEKTGVSDNFIFSGTVPYDEVPGYINVSDVCVAPFIKARNAEIGLSPLKIYEYMTCGKPIVASDISGVGDVLEQNNIGISVESENPEEIAKAIIKLLNDEKLREEMGENGREYSVKNHCWEVVARKVADVCGDVVR